MFHIWVIVFSAPRLGVLVLPDDTQLTGFELYLLKDRSKVFDIRVIRPHGFGHPVTSPVATSQAALTLSTILMLSLLLE